MPRRVDEQAVSVDADSPSALALPSGFEQVRQCWRADALLAEQSSDRFEELGARFVTWLTRRGVVSWQQVQESDCRAFIDAPTRTGTRPSAATQHLRRSTLRAIFRTLRTLQVLSWDPTLDIRLPPRQSRVYRPLTDDEVLVCRASSRLGEAGSGSLRRAIAWALGEATGATSEIGAVRLDDLDDRRDPRRVRFPASRRYAARQGQLSAWGRQVVARHAIELMDSGSSGGTLLAYDGAGPAGQYLAQSSVCTQVAKVLEVAGLREDPAVRARSLRGWAGESLYRRGMPLEQVAVRLGCNSLDAAAAEIGLQWKPPGPSS